MKQFIIGLVFGMMATALLLRQVTPSSQVQLGMTLEQVSHFSGREIKLSQGGRMYPIDHIQTETEKEQDLRYYFDDRSNRSHTFFYGFNAHKKLIQIIETRINELYSPLPFEPSAINK